MCKNREIITNDNRLKKHLKIKKNNKPGLIDAHKRIGETSPEDGGSIFFRNIGIYIQVHMALPARRQHRHFHHRQNLRSQNGRKLLKTAPLLKKKY
jgi:hypothetical protein